MIDFTVILFFAAAILNIKLRHRSEMRGYISVSQSANMEGLLIYGVFLLHLSAYASSGKLLHAFFLLDNPLVGVFFFYSGFGLLTQYKKKGREYTDSLLVRKLRAMLIPWLVCAVLYFLGYQAGMVSTAALIEGNIPHNMLESLGEWVANGWFVFVLLLFYGFFVLSARLSKGNIPRLIVLNSMMIGAYTIVMLQLKMGSWWYIRSFCFVLGQLWCLRQQHIDCILEKHAGKLFLSVSVILALLFFACYRGHRRAEFLMIPLFVLWVQLLCTQFVLDNAILRGLHRYQFPFYMIHGLALGVLRGNLIYIRSDCLYGMLALTAALAGSAALYFMINALNERIHL